MFDDFNENLRGEFLQLCKRLGVHPLMRAFEPMGRGAENWKDFEKNEEEHHVEQYSKEELEEARSNLMCFSCAAGRKEIMINPKGDIFPCGNLNVKDFAWEIFFKSIISIISLMEIFLICSGATRA